ncbi:hypothetical protein WJX73_007354 [Symbiochloris irregularis]|uniref:Uncharacterized protein n=1 Tax=Symbiochloris irregularis TaxID=706552 RepID=A0AAW1Q2R5_9CHLO
MPEGPPLADSMSELRLSHSEAHVLGSKAEANRHNKDLCADSKTPRDSFRPSGKIVRALTQKFSSLSNSSHSATLPRKDQVSTGQRERPPFRVFATKMSASPTRTKHLQPFRPRHNPGTLTARSSLPAAAKPQPPLQPLRTRESAPSPCVGVSTQSMVARVTKPLEVPHAPTASNQELQRPMTRMPKLEVPHAPVASNQEVQSLVARVTKLEELLAEGGRHREAPSHMVVEKLQGLESQLLRLESRLVSEEDPVSVTPPCTQRDSCVAESGLQNQSERIAGEEMMQLTDKMPQPLFADENAVPEYLSRLTNLQTDEENAERPQALPKSASSWDASSADNKHGLDELAGSKSEGDLDWAVLSWSSPPKTPAGSSARRVTCE